MSGYKVFQCSAMDYHLEPARYEKIVMTKMMARYELRMNCNWIKALQDALDVSSNIVANQMSIEAMRSALCTGEGFYNADGFTTGNNDSLDPINEQWAELIDVILRQTAWAAVADTAGVAAALGTTGAAESSRRVSQAKVDTEMGYTANVAAGSLVDGNFVATDKNVAATTDDQGRTILGIKAMVSQTPYDKEKLGDLLNNTNVGEVLGKMRNHGCFIRDEDQNKFVVNPFVQEALSGDASHSQALQTLLDKDDELVFPINLKSIAGHTADTADEDISTNAYELEINIVFKQSDSAQPADSDDAHHGNVDGVTDPVPAPATSDNVAA